MDKILIVDDDSKVRKLARVNLAHRGYLVDEAADGVEAIDYLKQHTPDLVLLDLVMPDISGIDVCIWMRAQLEIPIIVLSAHDDEELKVRALDAGADDYVTKPFGIEELLARVRAVMRRTRSESRGGSKSRIEIGDMVIDLDARRTFVDGVEIQLTHTEFVLLAELARNVDSVLTHEELLARVWGPEYRDASHYLYVYFGRIRKKVGTRYGQLLETVPGIGYLLRSAPA